MLVQRWQASLTPNSAQAHLILSQEGLETFSEITPGNCKVSDHRHPFGEVRIILTGSLYMNIAGNQVLLRAGDRIEIPANTRHSHWTASAEECVCICAHRVL